MRARARRKVCIVAWFGLLALATLAATKAPGRRPSFVDVTKEAGIQGITIDGTLEKKSILDVNGTGVCWLDYNNDGLVDLFIVNGSTIEDLKSGKPRRQRNYLYRNDGGGKFTDVTTQAGGLGADGVRGALQPTSIMTVSPICWSRISDPTNSSAITVMAHLQRSRRKQVSQEATSGTPARHSPTMTMMAGLICLSLAMSNSTLMSRRTTWRSAITGPCLRFADLADFAAPLTPCIAITTMEPSVK